MFADALERDGFAIIPELFSKTEIESLIEGMSAAVSYRSRAGIRHALELPLVAELSHRSNLLELARTVLGPAAFPFHATLFEKSSKSNWLVVWHQDTALPLRACHEIAGWGPWSVKEGVVYAHAPTEALSQVLALRIHLDDSTALNGPLRVLPGTHRLPVLDDDRIHNLSKEVSPVECLVPAGGILAMKPLLIHASSKSRVEADRRVLHIEYAASPLIAAPLDLAVPKQTYNSSRPH
jgi:ectoine hydroxylase-related dioxygenase (phytanoyl-CoA dioxygenase family)